MPASSQTKAVLLLSALGVSIFLIVRRFLVNRHYERIHGCKKVFRSLNKDPFLGLDTIPGTIRAFRQHKLLERSCELFRLYGNTFAVKELQRRTIVTIEPENIKTILSLKFSDYGLGHRLAAFKPLLGQGIFDTDGESWALSRALVRPSFTRDRIADLSSFEDLIRDLFSILPRDANQVVDLSELYFRYTIDSATEFLFGQSTGSLKQTASEPEFTQSFHYAQQGVLARLMLGPLSFLYRDRKAEKCNQICREFASRFVEKSFVAVGAGKAGNEQNGPQKRVISDELALRTTNRQRVLDETMNLLLAGRDTTASLLSNLFFMLAKDHLLWRKIRREVACLEGRPPTYQELRSFKFIQHCISESLRLHPVIPRNERKALKDTVLPVGGGEDGLSPIFVPKNTIVAFNLYAMHRRTDIYGPDAEDFRPERWKDDSLRPGWAYLPFNGGPRICIGQQYAISEAAYVVVRMAQEFQTIESADPGPWEEALALSLHSRNGVRVRLKRA